MIPILTAAAVIPSVGLPADSTPEAAPQAPENAFCKAVEQAFAKRPTRQRGQTEALEDANGSKAADPSASVWAAGLILQPARFVSLLTEQAVQALSPASPADISGGVNRPKETAPAGETRSTASAPPQHPAGFPARPETIASPAVSPPAAHSADGDIQPGTISPGRMVVSGAENFAGFQGADRLPSDTATRANPAAQAALTALAAAQSAAAARTNATAQTEKKTPANDAVQAKAPAAVFEKPQRNETASAALAAGAMVPADGTLIGQTVPVPAGGEKEPSPNTIGAQSTTGLFGDERAAGLGGGTPATARLFGGERAAGLDGGAPATARPSTGATQRAAGQATGDAQTAPAGRQIRPEKTTTQPSRNGAAADASEARQAAGGKTTAAVKMVQDGRVGTFSIPRLDPAAGQPKAEAPGPAEKTDAPPGSGTDAKVSHPALTAAAEVRIPESPPEAPQALQNVIENGDSAADTAMETLDSAAFRRAGRDPASPLRAGMQQAGTAQATGSAAQAAGQYARTQAAAPGDNGGKPQADDAQKNAGRGPQIAAKQRPAESESSGRPEAAVGVMRSDPGAQRTQHTEAAARTEPAPSAFGPEAAAQLARITLSAVSRGETQYRLKLRPEGVGEVAVTISARDRELHLTIHTSSESTRDLILDQIGGLKENLTAGGYHLGDCSVDVSTGGQNGSAFTFQQDPGRRQPERQPDARTGYQDGGGQRPRETARTGSLEARAGAINYRI